MSQIAEVLLPIPLSKTFDYWLSADNVGVGRRVLVEFGQGKPQVGLIMGVRAANDSDHDNTALKTITAVLDDFALVNPFWCELIRFAARYYAEPLGKAYRNAFAHYLRHTEPFFPPRLSVYSLSPAGKTVLATDSLPKNAHKQRRLLAALAAAPHVDYPTLRQQGFNLTEIQKLTDKALVECHKVPMYQEDTPIIPPCYSLNEEQQQIIDAITPTLATFHAHLLYGVTGSGKTEVYIHLITKVLADNKQVLLLVPEIALTPQMLSRFTQRFGRRVAAYHSGMSDNDRREVFLAAQAGELPILIGTRSAIFVPQANLGLILVDEEHDLSYKQHEGFLYHARDLAIYRAKQHNINVVLGSATPSLESIHNVEQGKLIRHDLTRRATQAALPSLSMIDRRGHGRQQVLSNILLQAIRQTVQQGKQVLLFLNRRGFAPVMQCNDCEWSSACPSCSVFQTAHTTTRQLCCHHCGHLEPLPIRCPDCQGADLYFVGAGTQKLESQIQQQFPQQRILRLDRDKQSTAKQLDKALAKVHQGEVDIILGTQLIVKGHHFPHVELVGVVDADSALFSGDFRAQEHLYQQLIQVAGRAGRQSNVGQVMIQSSMPNHGVFHALLQQDYWAYAQTLLAERGEYQLPPQTAMSLVKASALDKGLLLDYLRRVKMSLDTHAAAVETLGPVPLAIEKVRNRYQAQLWLSADNKTTMQKNLPLLQQIIHHYDPSGRFKTVIDVDAV